jgi:hypothetical protein
MLVLGGDPSRADSQGGGPAMAWVGQDPHARLSILSEQRYGPSSPLMAALSSALRRRARSTITISVGLAYEIPRNGPAGLHEA